MLINTHLGALGHHTLYKFTADWTNTNNAYLVLTTRTPDEANTAHKSACSARQAVDNKQLWTGSFFITWSRIQMMMTKTLTSKTLNRIASVAYDGGDLSFLPYLGCDPWTGCGGNGCLQDDTLYNTW